MEKILSELSGEDMAVFNEIIGSRIAEKVVQFIVGGDCDLWNVSSIQFDITKGNKLMKGDSMLWVWYEVCKLYVEGPVTSVTLSELEERIDKIISESNFKFKSTNQDMTCAVMYEDGGFIITIGAL